MRSDIPNTVYKLHTRSPEALWGVSAQSIYLSLCDIVDDQPMPHYLELHHKTTILRTNDERDPDEVALAHRFLHTEFGLITDSGSLTDRGRLILGADEPVAAVRLAAAERLERIQHFLREFDALDADRLPREEFETLTQNSYDAEFIAPLLCSLGFIDLYPEGIVLNQNMIHDTLDRIKQDANYKLTAVGLVDALTDIETPTVIAQVTSHLVQADISVDQIEQTDLLDALTTRGRGRRRTPIEDIEDAISDTKADAQAEATTLQTALGLSGNVASRFAISVDAEDVAIALSTYDPKTSDIEFVLDLLTTVHAHPEANEVALEPLTDTLELNQYDLYQVLSTIPGVNCNIQKNILIEFESIPEATGTDRYEERRQELFNEIHTRRSWCDSLDTSPQETTQVRETVIESLLSQIDEDVVKPIYFVYTLPDTLGKERMDRYVGDQPQLRRERAHLNRWKDRRRDDSRRFTEMTDRLFTRGQKHDLEERIVRIMTPYDDDTFSEYTSQLRSLLRDGYELRLLTRHTKQKWEWERLRDNLLGDLDENREKVTIRTYSRYKQYQRITSNTDESDLAEFGVHAKIQIIGHASEGAALLGSANFMENSYKWNPECGIYTENMNFVAAGIEFFDHVWKLSEVDEVDLSNLQEIPRRSFYPSYYT